MDEVTLIKGRVRVQECGQLGTRLLFQAYVKNGSVVAELWIKCSQSTRETRSVMLSEWLRMVGELSGVEYALVPTN